MLHRKRNDFGTPHCRVLKPVQEYERGKYRANLVDDYDVGLENAHTSGYDVRAEGVEWKDNTEL
jgi:hypothetical protein